MMDALLAASVLAAAAPMPFWQRNDLGLVVLSSGTWTTYGRLDGFLAGEGYSGGLERYEFNKPLATALYGQVLGLSAFLGLPLHWTAKRTEDGDVHRVAPGDLEIHLGKRLGRVEGRMGLIAPAGYDRGIAWTSPEGKGKDGDPWIGPGNFHVTLGAAANPNLTRYSRFFEASGEAKWAYALTDGIAKAGSWSFLPSAKLSLRPDPALKPGVELSGHWKSQHWGKAVEIRRAFDAEADWSAGMVATLFLEWFVTPGTAVGGKAGHSLWGYRDASSYHATAYLLYFPG